MAILLEAGAETTTNALETFVLAARLYPRIIGPAQAELESVVGTSRLPTVDDSPNLPYINAIVKETPLATSRTGIRTPSQHRRR